MATTTAIGNDATDLSAILQSAMSGSYVAHSSSRSFTVSNTIVIYVNSTTQGPLGLDLGGGTIYSNITDGSPVIKVVVGPGVDLRYLTFANFTIQGNGREGAGIQIVAAGNDRWVYNFSVNDVTVNHVGGYGLDVEGSVFEGIVSNSWMTNNAKGGAYFSHLVDGQASALRWFGGGLQNNGGAGIMLDNGVRDMSVDGVKFTGNQGGGISALSGITSVSNSNFQDNKGPGVSFQNYGNFTDNTFVSSGAQTVGITGWQNGGSTVVGNVSSWTGSGANPTTLANLQGYGTVYATGDVGTMVTGSSLSVSALGGGNAASVSVSTAGVAVPSLSAITAASTTAIATSSTGNPVETALKAAVATGSAHLTDATYSVSAPIVINLVNGGQGPINIDFGGAKIQSTIANGGPVIEIVVGAGVNVNQLTISNLMINGSGRDGDGIKIVADGADRSIRNLSINSVNVEHVGGIGLDVIGNVHGQVFDSWMHGNNGGGARFANGPNGGVADGLSWIGGGFRKNPVAGLILDNGTKDMTVKGAYFVDNVGVGIAATSGITLVKESGFENNGGTAIVTNGSATIVSDTFSTWGVQKVAVGGTLTGGTVSMSGSANEYYGSGVDPTVLANLQGSGTLAVAGRGPVVAGPGIKVTGGTLAASGAPGIGDGTAAAPVVTEALVSDTGSSLTDKITSVAALSGTADPNATVKFTVDGTAISATAKADAGGKWSFTPTGLADGQHTVVASQTNAGGTSSAGVTFTLDTTAPTITSKLANDTGASATDKVTSDPTISGTAAANSTVKLTIDGTAVAATVTADASGTWGFTPTGLTAGQHTVVASQTDTAGNAGTTSLSFTLDTVSGTVTPKLASDTGASATDKITSSAALSGTATPNAVIKFTVDGNPVAASVTANASGNWSFTPAGLADGQHTIVATQTDAGGNSSAGTLTFTLDKTAPVVTASATTSVPGASGTADPNSTIRFTVDGTASTATATADATGRWSYTPSGLSAGTHTVVASQTDLAGNTGSASFTLTAGASSGTSGATPAAALGFTGASWANGQLTLTGTTTGPGQTLWIYDGNNWAGAASSDASGRFNFTEAAAIGSVHSFGAIAIDSAGVTTKITTPFVYTAAASTTAPSTGSGTDPSTGSTDPGTGSGTSSGTNQPPTDGHGLPLVTEKLVSDTGASASDGITTNAALTGTADPHATVHFTIDGAAVAATAAADASGNWSYNPAGLHDGFHTAVASVTDADGYTGAATIGFTYNTHAPIPSFTGESVSNGKVTITGTTGEAGDTVSIYDGNSWAGFATTGADGRFSFTTTASAGVHSYGANASGPLGEGHGVGNALLGSAGADTLVGTGGRDVMVGNGGNDVLTGGLGADKLTGGSGSVTFKYTAAAESTAAAADLITDFHHGDKIDFTAIAGINASNGTPAFQGYLGSTGSQTLNAHSVAVMEVGGNTQVMVNTSDSAHTVTATDMHAADINIVLTGVNLALTGNDFHHN